MAMKSRRFDVVPSKLDIVRTINICRKININTILTNIETNLTKLAHICRYKLDKLATVTFLTHTVHLATF